MKKISDKVLALIIIGIVFVTIFALSYVINQFFYKDTTWFRNLNIIEKLGDIWAQHLWKIVVTLILGPTFFVYRRRKKNKKEKEKSWVKRHPRWTSFIVVVMIVFLPPSGQFLYDLNHPTHINQEVEKKDQKKEEIKAQQETKKENNETEIPFSTKVIGGFFILLTAFLYIRNIVHQQTEKKDLEGKILVEKKEWGEILTTPMMAVLYVVLGVNLLLSILIPILWSFFWSDQILFWSINLGIIFLALLKTRKDKNGKDGKVIPHFQIAAKVFGIILVIGLLYQLSRNPYWNDRSEGNNKSWLRSIFSRTPKFNSLNRGYIFSPEHMDAEVALKVIGSCESTGAPNNDPVHYEEDSKTLLQNIQGSGAQGMYQFMPDHIKEAEKIGLDILNKKEDYIKYAIDLYNRTGTKHWQFDSHKGGGPACWGETLSKLAQEREEFEIEIIAPPSSEGPIARVNIFGYKVSWDESEEGLVVKADDGRTAEFSKEKKEALFGKNTDVLTFNSTDEKTKKVKIKFTKIKT